MATYACKIIDWLDGDTCHVAADLDLIDLGFHITLFRTIRVFGMNAPEVHSLNPDEKTRGLASKARAIEMVPVGTVVTVSPAKTRGIDKYGRWLASIVLPDGKDYATEMIAEKYALPWDGVGEKPI
jgi:endonuclease YncB( thermonuclease family)